MTGYYHSDSKGVKDQAPRYAKRLEEWGEMKPRGFFPRENPTGLVNEVVVELFEVPVPELGMGDAGDGQGLLSRRQSPQVGHPVFRHDDHGVVGRGRQAPP